MTIMKKTLYFHDTYEQIQHTIDDALGQQYLEYTSSVNNLPQHGLHGKLPFKFQQTQSAIDEMLAVLARASQEIMTFRTEFMEKLTDKENFYSNLGKHENLGDMGNSDAHEKDQP